MYPSAPGYGQPNQSPYGYPYMPSWNPYQNWGSPYGAPQDYSQIPPGQVPPGQQPPNRPPYPQGPVPTHHAPVPAPPPGTQPPTAADAPAPMTGLAPPPAMPTFNAPPAATAVPRPVAAVPPAVSPVPAGTQAAPAQPQASAQNAPRGFQLKDNASEVARANLKAEQTSYASAVQSSTSPANPSAAPKKSGAANQSVFLTIISPSGNRNNLTNMSLLAEFL